MSRWLRLSTAQTERIGPFLDATDGVTEETGLGSPPTELSKDGGAFAAGPTGTHDAEGWYSVALTTTHTNTLGSLVIKSHDSTTHLPVWHEFMVIPADVYDSLVLGTDTLPADVTQWLGTAVATPTVAGVPEVDLTHMEGGTQTVTDLKDFADAGYDPATNKVQGVVLVDTTTTNTDVRGTDSAALASVCTEVRLAELDAANLPTDVDAILADTADMQPKIGTPAADVSADIAAVKTEADKIALADAGAGVAGSLAEEIQNRDAIADALLDRTNAIETGLTLRECQRLLASATAAKVSGAATTTMTFRNAIADSKNRMIATVDDPGNRSAIIYDLTS